MTTTFETISIDMLAPGIDCPPYMRDGRGDGRPMSHCHTSRLFLEWSEGMTRAEIDERAGEWTALKHKAQGSLLALLLTKTLCEAFAGEYSSQLLTIMDGLSLNDVPEARHGIDGVLQGTAHSWRSRDWVQTFAFDWKVPTLDDPTTTWPGINLKVRCNVVEGYAWTAHLGDRTVWNVRRVWP